MSAITAKASRKMKKNAVLTREPRCFLGSFDFSWEQRKFSDITFPAGEKNRDNLPLESYSITNEHGFVPQDEKFENGGTMREADKRMYYIVSPNSFAYNPARINVGSIGYQNIGKNVIVSSLYEVFKTSEDVDDRLLWHWFKSHDFQKLIMQLQEGGVRLYFYYDKLCMGEVSLPSLEEQRKIGKLFDTLDNLITLHQRKCALLFSPFQAFISMMFTTSTFSWEQRKLTEFVEFFSGLTYTPNDVQENGTLVLRSSNVSNGEVVDADNVYVNPQVVNSENVKVGDIVVVVRNGSRSLIGKHAQIKAFMPNTVIGAFMTGIRSECPEFTNALLNTSRFEEEIAMNMGATINQITGYMFSKMEFKVPCLDEQKKIGEYFEKLDNLITLHQRKCIFFTGRAGRLISTVNKKRITSSWEQRKLGDIADIVGGGTPSTGNQSYWDGDIDWYAPAEIADQIYANSSQKKITGLGYENSSAKMLPPGTVLFTSRAGIGKTAILTRKGCTNQGFQSIVPHRGELDSYFIFSRTEELKRYGELVGAGSTFVEVSGKQMAVMELMMPPTMREQQTIGGFFQQLDHLITLHQRKFEKLTNVKKSMLEKMFPQNGSSYPEIRFKGFTDPWEQRKLGDVVQITMGQSPDGSTYSDEPSDYILVQGNADLQNGWVCPRIWTTQITKKADAGDLIMSVRAPAGAMGKTAYNAVFGRGVAAIKGNEFIYQLLVKMDTDGFWKTLSCGSTFESLNSDNIKNAEVKIPTTAEQKKIGGLFQDLDNLITLHQRELEKLQNIKKSMLEKMFV